MLDRPAGGLDTGVIAVVINNDAFGKSPEKLGLLRRERRAEARRRIRDAVLVKCDQIEIAFDQDRELLLPDLFLRLKQPVKMLAFCICRRFRRIEIFRLVVAHRPCPESDRPAVDIENRKHYPAAKTVENAVFFFVDGNEPALLDQLFVGTFLV